MNKVGIVLSPDIDILSNSFVCTRKPYGFYVSRCVDEDPLPPTTNHPRSGSLLLPHVFRRG